MFVASDPRVRPVKPPIINRKINEIAYRRGGFRSIDPPYIVETQLNTLMALGIATIKVRNEKNHLDE
jgi:hypothetical protein